MVHKTHVDENRTNRGKKLPPIATDSVLRLSASTSLRSQPTPVGVDVGVRVYGSAQRLLGRAQQLFRNRPLKEGVDLLIQIVRGRKKIAQGVRKS